MRQSQAVTPPNSLDVCLHHPSPEHFFHTCPGEGGDRAEGKGSAEAPGQRRGGRLTLPGTLMVIDELGQVGRWGRDEGFHQVRRREERLAAEGGRRRATCKESATQEQRNRLQHELVIKTSTCKTLPHHRGTLKDISCLHVPHTTSTVQLRPPLECEMTAQLSDKCHCSCCDNKRGPVTQQDTLTFPTHTLSFQIDQHTQADESDYIYRLLCSIYSKRSHKMLRLGLQNVQLQYPTWMKPLRLQ